MEKEWIIIGGGICGLTAAVHLLKHQVTAIDELLIIDSESDFLHRWQTKAARTGMGYLRSPSVHHLDDDPFSLQKFAKKNGWTTGFSGVYKRPAIDLFHQHCDTLIQELNLRRSYKQATVNALSNCGDNYVIETAVGDRVQAKQVVVATGMMDNVLIPDWAVPISQNSPEKCHHLLSASAIDESGIAPPLLVVGGGISACQAALKWSERFPEKVTLNMRHPFRIAEFDSDPGWLGPKYMNCFFETGDVSQRRSMINDARIGGSLPAYLYRKLKKAVQCKQLVIIEDEIAAGENKESGIQIEFKKHESIEVSQILFCTGYQKQAIVPSWLSDYAGDMKLPIHACGTPIVDAQLKWRSGLYLTGPMAELQIGPTARNIAGAKKAAKLIAASARQSIKPQTHVFKPNYKKDTLQAVQLQLNK